MKEKGFTLIELLAVIVILAIIALIVTPKISEIIISAKHAANARSVEGHIKNIEYAIIEKAFGAGNDNLDGYDDKETEQDIRTSLTLPEGDNILCTTYKIKNGTVMEAKGCTDSSDNWDKSYDYEDGRGAGVSENATPSSGNSSGVNENVTIPDDSETDSDGITQYVGTRITNTTSKYFNVNTGEACQASEVNDVASSIFSGCLEFVPYMEDATTYTMVLAKVVSVTYGYSESTRDNLSGPLTILYQLKNLTDNWKGTITPSNYTYKFKNKKGNDVTYTIPYEDDGYHARLITTNEIARLVGKTDFNSYTATKNDWFYFDGTNETWQTRVADATHMSNYWWLCNGTSSCLQYGCRDEISDYLGITTSWTSDSTSGTNNQAWGLHSGELYSYPIGQFAGYDVVIRVLKSKFQ